MSQQTKNVTYWILFILVALITFGLLYSAIGETKKEIETITTHISQLKVVTQPQSNKQLNQIDTTQTNTQIQGMNTNKEITRAIFQTNYGDIEVTFRKETPETVENFIKLAGQGFYDGTRFHRVIQNFMIQGGDPQSRDVTLKDRWGTGGPGYVFKDEVFPNDQMNQGVLAMANAGPGTNGSQFFIVTAPQGTDWLVGRHTIFGTVTRGLDVALAIEKVPTEFPGKIDRPIKDVVIEKVILQ